MDARGVEILGLSDDLAERLLKVGIFLVGSDRILLGRVGLGLDVGATTMTGGAVEAGGEAILLESDAEAAAKVLVGNGASCLKHGNKLAELAAALKNWSACEAIAVTGVVIMENGVVSDELGALSGQGIWNSAGF